MGVGFCMKGFSRLGGMDILVSSDSCSLVRHLVRSGWLYIRCLCSVWLRLYYRGEIGREIVLNIGI